MSSSRTRHTASVGKRLLQEIAVPAPATSRTSKILTRTLAADGFTPVDINMALKKMYRDGLIAKDDHLADRRSPTLGHAWSLTPEGLARHDRQLAEQTSWEIAAHEADQPDRR